MGENVFFPAKLLNVLLAVNVFYKRFFWKKKVYCWSKSPRLAQILQGDLGQHYRLSPNLNFAGTWFEFSVKEDVKRGDSL